MHAVSPILEDNRELDKYVLLKGGKTKTPVPGKYAENGSAKTPATKRCHCALKAPPLSLNTLMLGSATKLEPAPTHGRKRVLEHEHSTDVLEARSSACSPEA